MAAPAPAAPRGLRDRGDRRRHDRAGSTPGAKKAVGRHDWGSPVVWGIASHHPDRYGVANLCGVLFRRMANFFGLIDREVYPADQYPLGQWDYQVFYLSWTRPSSKPTSTPRSSCSSARAIRPAPASRRLPPGSGATAAGFPAASPRTCRAGGGSPQRGDLRAYAASLKRNGFFGPTLAGYEPPGRRLPGPRGQRRLRLTMPVLFLHAEYDWSARPCARRWPSRMRDNLTEAVPATGHWMAQAGQRRPRPLARRPVRPCGACGRKVRPEAG